MDNNDKNRHTSDTTIQGETMWQFGESRWVFQAQVPGQPRAVPQLTSQVPGCRWTEANQIVEDRRWGCFLQNFPFNPLAPGKLQPQQRQPHQQPPGEARRREQKKAQSQSLCDVKTKKDEKKEKRQHFSVTWVPQKSLQKSFLLGPN